MLLEMPDEANCVLGSVDSIDLKQHSVDSIRDELWSSQRDFFRFVDLSFQGLPFVFALWGESTVSTRSIGGSGGSGIRAYLYTA